ncbi:unnamed protein product, partial [Nesidiocoris tenuis]
MSEFRIVDAVPTFLQRSRITPFSSDRTSSKRKSRALLTSYEFRSSNRRTTQGVMCDGDSGVIVILITVVMNGGLGYLWGIVRYGGVGRWAGGQEYAAVLHDARTDNVPSYHARG